MNAKIVAIVLGVLTLTIGMVMGDVIISVAATSGGASIGSFTGASALKDLVPLVYYAAIVVIGVGLMGVGLAGYASRGPLR